MGFDEVITKIKRVQFLPRSIEGVWKTNLWLYLKKVIRVFGVIFIPLEWHLISQRPRSVAKNISRRY